MENKAVLYFFDPLCGWCYGFNPVILKLSEKYSGKIPFRVICGGMILGDNEGPINKVAAYINVAHKTVEQTTGVKFGNTFIHKVLAEGTIHFSSLYPSRMFNAFKLLVKNNDVDLAHEIQKVIYSDGKDLNEIESYFSIAKKYNIPEELLRSTLSMDQTVSNTDFEFNLTRELGVNGFPNVYLLNNSKLTPICNGYTSFDSLEKRLIELIN